MPHSIYLPEKMGSATVEPTGSFEAGSYQSFKLTYTAGYFGIDDTGSIKIVHRFASDMGKPQFDDPSAANYVSVVASNAAILHVEYDMKRNIRPWDKTLYIKVVRGFLREGDQIVVHFGDRSSGSPGIRIQTFCENSFEFRVLVDAIATYNYVELPQQPEIAIVPGKPHLWKAVVPTTRRIGESFRLSIKAEDRWGNPSDQCDQTIYLRSAKPIIGLPESIAFEPGQRAVVIDELSASSQTACLWIDLLDEKKQLLARSNPLRIVGDTELLPFWGDLHGQSEETIGTNSARDYHEFARNLAFLDATAHQGNDFQITSEFWQHLNDLTREFNQNHRFIAFPGYEWSGNTGLGGDRNVLYLQEGQPIYRSSHALVDDLSDVDSDATSARELFNRLQGRDCLVFAHIGGRYADVKMAHDERLETSVEVHSAWGSFEWLVDDALEKGYRVGIVSNSDGHKGRPGASHPGATKFGSYGGLTCMLATELTREALADCIRKRHHYGTTGCRMILDVTAEFDSNAELFDSDPNLGEASSRNTRSAMMGDILCSEDAAFSLLINAVGSAPIERVEIRNGLQTLETWRPYSESDLGHRICIAWEGSEYRGRGRETIWDGKAILKDNIFESVEAINRYNIDKRFEQTKPNQLEWQALTTGGHGGFYAMLESRDQGVLSIDTELVKADIAVGDIGYEDTIIEAGGLGRRIRVFRMPDDNPHYQINLARRISLIDGRDNAVYIRIVQQDGHVIWSSPIYLFR
ncbi:MAG: DUF3604 domain-containing protein [Gammaproteobacteria bacterium]